MKPLTAILLLFILPATSFTQELKLTIQAMASTYNFNGDTLGGGTCFMINKDNNQYFVTAAHLFKETHHSGDIIPVEILIQNQLESFDAKVYFHKNKNVDVAIMKLTKQVSQLAVTSGISLDTIKLYPGVQVFFYGFPLTNLGTEVIGIKLPLVKKAIISGLIQYNKVDVIVLDGHNNHGFSGGPVLAYDTSKKIMCVVGVVSSYLYEPKRVQFKEDKLLFNENSGIILCYGRQYIEEILKEIK